MNSRTYKVLFITLPILTAIAAFEILNIDDYYKDQIEVPQILISESTQSAQEKEKLKNDLIREGVGILHEKYLAEAFTIIAGVSWISVIYYNERKKSENPSL